MHNHIQHILREHDIDFTVTTHEPVFTVADSLNISGYKTPVKNLLLQEEKGDRLVLIIMNGLTRLDTKRIAAELGTKKLQFAKPDALKVNLGVEPGSVSLFSLLNDHDRRVEVVIDAWLTQQEAVGFHPNDNSVTINIAGADIARFLDAQSIGYGVMPL